MRNIKNKTRSFTLIEIIIVIAIIGILLGIIIVNFSEARAFARDTVRMSDLRTFEKMLEMYKDTHNRYPTSTLDFQIEGYAWGSSWNNYGVVPKDLLSPRQDYAYISDQGQDYQIYAKFEREPVKPPFACQDPCGPNAEYNGGIASKDTSLIAFETPPLPSPEPEPEPGPDPEPGPEPEPEPGPDPEPGPEPEPEPGPDPEPGSEPEPIICSPAFSDAMRGEQIYSVSGSAANPRITKVTINPLDVNKFATQTVTVLARDTAGNNITLVQGQAFTDNTSFSFDLELISGTETDGTWQGQWYNEDEYCNNYQLLVRAVSGSGTFEAVLTFR